MVKSTYKVVDVAEIFMREILRLHEVPIAIAFDKDTKFIPNFLKNFAPR
jgi:hypothetical protein